MPMPKKLNPNLRFVTAPEGDQGAGGSSQGAGGSSQPAGLYVAEPQQQKPQQGSSDAKFTQEDLERILGERVARERRDAQRETEELREKAAKYDETVEAQKSAETRAAEALAQAQRDAEAAKLDAARYRAAASHGINGDYIDLLSGGKDVDTHAQRLGELIKAKNELDALRELENNRPQYTGVPRPNLRPGTAGADEDPAPSSADAARAAAERRGRVRK